MNNRKHEKFVAVCSFFAAVALAFTSLVISSDHDIAAGVLMMCAQFLTLTATIFGIDYKFTYPRQPKTHDKQNRNHIDPMLMGDSFSGHRPE